MWNSYCLIKSMYTEENDHTTIIYIIHPVQIKNINIFKDFLKMLNKYRLYFVIDWRKLIDKAMFWLENVSRHKWAQHLRPVAVELTLYKYYSLDVITFIILIIYLLIGIFYVFIKYILKLIFNLLFKQKKKSKTCTV